MSGNVVDVYAVAKDWFLLGMLAGGVTATTVWFWLFGHVLKRRDKG